ncbi:hypothetical protein VTK73DRAFT_4966 [Phialemonium thermophilum]|uniref:Zn(2)-C6 fungal-type domain-containing protein n=1 Tax=Phialemonium thermophilum TaxID=223376 RepID=A0ABR3XYS2_9PEZI
MSTASPSHRGDLVSGQTGKMAVAQSAKSKSANRATGNAASKQKSQMHRRSRTGCYTCRLRRKKCDEGSPMCTACRHLGLACEYKRPLWWSNNDARRTQKDDIKMIIKRKKINEKASHAIQTSMSSPPGLSHSLPTSATFSDPADRTRSASIDSHFGFNFNSPPSCHQEFTPYTPQVHPDFAAAYGAFPPYDIDIKTERQMFVNDVPTLRESTTSSFSTYPTPPPPQSATFPSFPPEGEWTEQVFSERREFVTEETVNIDYVDPGQQAPLAGAGPEASAALELDDRDKQLVDYFIQTVLPTLFPVLEASSPAGTSLSSDLIVPSLQSNPSYLHCCLSIAAQHFKAAMGIKSEEIDADIMRHRYATISSLCDALTRDENHQQILEATLGLIYFQCSVGRSDDGLLDIPWHQHFQAVVSLVQKLDLPRIVSSPEFNSPTQTAASDPNLTSTTPGNNHSSSNDNSELPPLQQRTPFSMTLTAWIDILGATMQGRAPVFAHTYREKHLSTTPSLGLRELTGCDDRVLYLISEIACLEALKKDGMDDITLCQHVHVLGDQIGLTEMGEPPLPFLVSGPGADNHHHHVDEGVVKSEGAAAADAPAPAPQALSAEQLRRYITAAFRLAARIHLCSLVPGFAPTQASCVGLVEKLAAVLRHIPSSQAGGFDQALVWVYLIGGSVSGQGSSLRQLIEERAARMGSALVGGFGRVYSLLREVWAQADALAAQLQQLQPQTGDGSHGLPAVAPMPLVEGSPQYVHWRDVMQMKNWDFLLI